MHHSLFSVLQMMKKERMSKKGSFFFFKLALQCKNRLHCVIKLKRNSTFQVVESFHIPLVDVSPGAVEDEIDEKRKGKKTFT